MVREQNWTGQIYTTLSWKCIVSNYQWLANPLPQGGKARDARKRRRATCVAWVFVHYWPRLNSKMARYLDKRMSCEKEFGLFQFHLTVNNQKLSWEEITKIMTFLIPLREESCNCTPSDKEKYIYRTNKPSVIGLLIKSFFYMGSSGVFLYRSYSRRTCLAFLRSDSRVLGPVLSRYVSSMRALMWFWRLSIAPVNSPAPPAPDEDFLVGVPVEVEMTEPMAWRTWRGRQRCRGAGRAVTPACVDKEGERKKGNGRSNRVALSSWRAGCSPFLLLTVDVAAGRKVCCGCCSCCCFCFVVVVAAAAGRKGGCYCHLMLP